MTNASSPLPEFELDPGSSHEVHAEQTEDMAEIVALNSLRLERELSQAPLCSLSFEEIETINASVLASYGDRTTPLHFDSTGFLLTFDRVDASVNARILFNVMLRHRLAGVRSKYPTGVSFADVIDAVFEGREVDDRRGKFFEAIKELNRILPVSIINRITTPENNLVLNYKLTLHPASNEGSLALPGEEVSKREAEIKRLTKQKHEAPRITHVSNVDRDRPMVNQPIQFQSFIEEYFLKSGRLPQFSEDISPRTREEVTDFWTTAIMVRNIALNRNGRGRVGELEIEQKFKAFEDYLRQIGAQRKRGK